MHRFPPLARSVVLPLAAGLLLPAAAVAQCDEEPPLNNFTGAGSVVCPCFIVGEEAGAVLTPPAGGLPIEVLRVGIGWASQFGGAPQSLEAAIKVYGAGLPNPGAPLASLGGPVLTDGFINEFDLEGTIGAVTVNSAPFTVTLEFFNENSGDIFAPTMIHDGNGCQPGKNVVKAIPGGWFDACALGVTGDWIVYAIYRPANCATGVEEILVSSGAGIVAASPNPFRQQTQVQFVLPQPAPVDLAVYDAQGRRVAVLADRAFGAGMHRVEWDGRAADGGRAAAGTYFLRLVAGDLRSTSRIVHLR